MPVARKPQQVPKTKHCTVVGATVRCYCCTVRAVCKSPTLKRHAHRTVAPPGFTPTVTLVVGLMPALKHVWNNNAP